ncbi:DsbA family protein [Denitrobaculum tricleocarpae]|uniref:DsbA family protein n=1 Tax=Denitrobaculum tricleocarpae TaxID=2591009 RepID=A0A545U1Z2_9PROT|nr:DsbA family protein [Denitrobaculum tricleocarpae]TQV83495.1 DsbA family protein [Denitrobaculum tricleocarpae]
MNRRKILTTTAAVSALAVGSSLGLRIPSAKADEVPLYDDDRFVGSPDAPITIIEYASLTCPHCASFHANTYPELKKQWIDTGRAKLVFRHFPLDGLGLRAAAVSNCLEGDRHFGFIEILMKSMQQWARAADPTKALAQISALAGINQEQFEKCFNDEAEMDKILARRAEANTEYDVNSTPSFLVNGRLVTGALDFTAFNRLLEDEA